MESSAQRQHHDSINAVSEEDDQYHFIPASLRHHFKADLEALFLSEKEERCAVRDVRRTRSALVVSTLLSASSQGGVKSATPTTSAGPSRPLYSHGAELALSTRVAFGRSSSRLEEYFTTLRERLRLLEEASPMLVPSWLDDGGVTPSYPTKLPTLLQVQRQIVNTCYSCLSDCDVYLAMLDPLPAPPAASPTPLLRFMACSQKSSMLNRVLPCSLKVKLPGSSQCSVSAIAIQSKRSIVIEDVSNDATHTIVSFSQSACPTGPFACFPLISYHSSSENQDETETAERTYAIGVLSLDSCRKAVRQRADAMTIEEVYRFFVREKQVETAQELRKLQINGAQLLLLTENDVMRKAAFQKLKIAAKKTLLALIQSLKRGSNRHLPHNSNLPRFFIDDPTALEFLSSVAQSSGVFLDGYRTVHWSREMAEVTKNPVCSIYDVFEVLVRGVAHAIASVGRVVVWKIAAKGEIGAIASTELPDDRLEPFLRWEERMIKRVALFKEREIPVDADQTFNNDLDGLQFVQGSVTKIVFFQGDKNMPPNDQSGSAAALCETATYNIAWANRTYQSLSWRQLRQFLPIRSLNSKHYQLKTLVHEISRLNHKQEIMSLKDPNALVLTIRDEFRPRDAAYVLEVDFPKNMPPDQVRSSATVAFLQRAVAITERSLACVNGRTRRRMRRERSVATLASRFGCSNQASDVGDAGRLIVSKDALQDLSIVVTEIFRDITENLPGADIQIAELQPDGTQLKYTFVGGGSTVSVEKTTIQRGQGVSFKCLDLKSPLIADPTLSPDVYKLLRSVSNDRRGSGAQHEAPYVFIPLIHDDSLVGVLSVDSFKSVPKGRNDESHPELGVVDYLQSLAGLLATEIYRKRRSHALHKLQQLATANALRSPHQLYLDACRALQDVIIGTWKVRLVEVDSSRGKTSSVFDYSEAERLGEPTARVRAVEPLRLLQNELLPDTIATYVLPMALGSSDAEELYSTENLIDAVNASSSKDNEQHKELKELVTSRSSLGLPLSATEKQRLEMQRLHDTYFWLLKPEEKVVAMAKENVSRVSSEKYTHHALGLFLATKTFFHAPIRTLAVRPDVFVFLVVSCLPQFHAECDYAYVSQVGEVLARSIETCHARVERSRLRVDVVQRFREMCEQEVQGHLSALLSDETVCRDDQQHNPTMVYRHRLSPREELDVEALLQLQCNVIELIHSVLHHPNVYIGLFEPSRDRIKFTSASTGSVMKGKQLKRGMGVSFYALDRQESVVVTRSEFELGQNHASAHKVRLYSTEQQKWPFIVVPIGRFGVLSVDNLERYERLAGESQPELGMVDFLRRMAAIFSDALVRVRRATRDHRRMLRTKSLLQIMATCEDRRKRPLTKASDMPGSSPTTTPQVLIRYVVKQLERALNGINAYVGLVDPLCRSIQFVCASSFSSMEGKTINATRSISFQVYASQTSIVVHDLRTHYRALAESQRLVKPSTELDSSQKILKFFSTNEPSGAFICVPIPFLGVLSIDTLPGAACGLYSPVTQSISPPEDGVVEFLEQAAALIGESIRIQRANALQAVLPTLFQGNITSFGALFHSLISLLAENLPAAVQISAVQLPKDICCLEYNWASWSQASVATLSRSKEDGGVCDQYDDAIARYLKTYYSQKCYLCRRECTGNAWDADVVQLSRCSEVIVVHCADSRDVTVDVEDGDPNGDMRSLRYLTIVVKRVEKATWTYDLDLLNKILPAINSLIRLVNPRIQGMVRRRMALKKLKLMKTILDQITPGSRAVLEMKEQVLPEAMELMARAMSGHNERDNPCCDVYLGERSVFVSGMALPLPHPSLTYIAASKRSLMAGVTLNLSQSEVQAMATVQVLENSKDASKKFMPTTVNISKDAENHKGGNEKRSHFFGRRNNYVVRQLTTKPAQRVLVIVPVGDDHILCADTLSIESLTLAHDIEADVVDFFHNASRELASTIQTTLWRASFDEMIALRYIPHSNPRAFFGLALSILRRDLTRFHSAQIILLGEDFTCNYECRAWLGAPTRRHATNPVKSKLQTKSLVPEHICSASDCSRALLADSIHFETRVMLPMANVPRTLDQCRSSQQPTEGLEKRGAFATSCLATMLDASVVEHRGRIGHNVSDARWALCVYHHDAVAVDTNEPKLDPKSGIKRDTRQRGWKSVTFTPAQRQYFFAFSAVAAGVFVDVWRSCVLDSSALEAGFVFLEQEGLSAVKELAVVRVVDDARSSGEINDDADTLPRHIEAIHVVFSTVPTKHASGKTLRRGKLATRLSQFHQTSRSNDVGVYMTRKVASEQNGVPAPTTSSVTTFVDGDQRTTYATQHAETNEPPASKQREGGSSFFGGRSLFKKRKPELQKPPTPAEVAVKTVAATLAPRQAPPISLYVLVRIVAQPKARCTDYVLMVVENTSVSVATPIEAGARKIKQQIDTAFKKAGVGSSEFPRGDEEFNAKRFCTKPGERVWCDDGGGGGFLLLELLKEAREQMRLSRVSLEALMREVLLETHSKGGVLVPGSSATSQHSDSSMELTISIRAALAAAGHGGASGHGFSRDQLATMSLIDLCRDFLRLSICDILLALNPMDRHSWGALSRARTLLTTSSQISASEAIAVSNTSPEAEPASPAPYALKTRHEGVAALLELLRVCFATLRYLRHLEASMVRSRRDTLDAPAIVVQCAYRCTRAKRELVRRQHEYVAALTIQCAFRQHLARRVKLFREWTRAAVRIQRAFRSWRMRKLHGGRLLAAKMKNELHTIAGKLKASETAADYLDGRQDDGMWRRDMAAFDTFAAFVGSRIGKAQVKREEAILHKKRHSITVERMKSGDGDADSIMWAELGDIFELLDEQGDGELSRERVLELMKRVHIPLDASEAEDVVAMMDSDHSGAISLQEFSGWLTYELPGLRRRSKDCGKLSIRDWQWVIHESAVAALRKRWRAMRHVVQAEGVGTGNESSQESV